MTKFAYNRLLCYVSQHSILAHVYICLSEEHQQIPIVSVAAMEELVEANPLQFILQQVQGYLSRRIN